MGHGGDLRDVYTRVPPDGGGFGDRLGADHAKVLFASSNRTLFVGSTNFTNNSQASVEACAQISLWPEGVDRISAWFNGLWANATPRVYSQGASSGSGRAQSRSRARSQSVREPRPARAQGGVAPPYPRGAAVEVPYTPPADHYGHTPYQAASPWANN